MAGVKETQEALSGALAIAVCIVEAGRDGYQWSDIGEVFGKLTSDPVLKAKVDAAWKDIGMVQDEIKDLDMSEVFSLLAGSLPDIQKLIEAFKKPEPAAAE